jgi:hypothetical protein
MSLLELFFFTCLLALFFEPSFIALLVAFAVLFATAGTVTFLVALFLFATRIATTAIFARERCRSTARQAQREHTDL